MKKLPNYLQDRQSSLAQLQHKVAALNRLSLLLQHYLPEPLNRICQVVRHDLNQDLLVISVSEPIFLTQLRFLRPHLLQQLRNISPFKQLHQIEIVFSPKAPGPNQANNPSVELSPDARAACLNAAELCSHPALQQALLRLATLKPLDIKTSS